MDNFAVQVDSAYGQSGNVMEIMTAGMEVMKYNAQLQVNPNKFALTWSQF